MLPILAATWAAGCSDDDPVAAGNPDAGTDAPVVVVPEAGGDAPPGRCDDQIDADGLAKVLSCSGLYSDIATKTVAADALPYKPATEFWSDGAEKARWIHIPAGTKIDTSDMDEWVFPDGTTVWKEFKLGGKRIETRIFFKLKGTWQQTSYRWNDDETEATRIPAGDVIPRTDDAGGPDASVYEIPTQQACMECHRGRKDKLLGVDAISLGLPGATGVTLATLVAEKKLTVDPALTALAMPAATAESGGDKAAAGVRWLHANCGACHNGNVGAGAQQLPARMLLKATELLPVDGGPVAFDQLEAYKTTICQDAFRTEPGGSVALKFIRPGEPARSATAILSGTRVDPPGESQMPPLVTRIVDVEGHKVFTDWISAMTITCPAP